MKKGLMKRACSYNVAVATSVDARTYSKILVTFAQDQEILITKTEADFDVQEAGFTVQLSQEETLQFRPSLKSVMGRRIGSPVYMQVRAYRTNYDAPGSDNYEIDVIDSHSEEVLRNA